MTIDILSALERARIPKRSGLVLTRTLAAGSCFTDRLTAPHFRRLQDRTCPALVLATKERYTQNLRLISPFSRSEPYGALGKEDFSGGVGSRKQGIGPLESRLGWKAKGEGTRKTLWS